MTDTLARLFAKYRQEVMPVEASAGQVTETQRAFYAAAACMLHLLLLAANDLEDGIERMLADIDAEIRAFSEAEVARAGGAPVDTYTTPDALTIAPILRQLGTTIAEQMPPGYGFTLLIFSFGEGGSMSYLSNAERSTMITAMQEFIRRNLQ